MAKRSKEKVVVVGFGWVGQANALSLKITGSDVYYFDIAKPQLHYADKYSNVYGDIPALAHPLEKDSENTWYVVCVGDKVSEDRHQDISAIEKTLAQLKDTKGGIVLRSTILPEYLSRLDFDYYVPEFLHEKFAVEECASPHFFVLGNRRSLDGMPDFLLSWEERSFKVFKGTPEEASLVKYLSNIWNALRIAFVNEFGDAVREPKTQRDIDKTSKILDYVLGKRAYLRYGKSFGGHCLPKDLRAFLGAYSEEGNTQLLTAVYDTNLAHKALEEKYQSLPEWFSSWESGTNDQQSPWVRVWKKINSTPLVLSIRRRLRFLKDWTENILSTPSFKKQREVWNTYANKNHRFYMNPHTKSRHGVGEDEFRDAGKHDVEEYLLRDELLRELGGNFSDRTILEVGSGSGRMTEFLSEAYKEVHGIDIAEGLIDIAKKRLKDLGNVKFVTTTGDTIPLSDENVDVVFSYLSLQFMPDREAIKNYIGEMARILRSGGVGKIQVRTGEEPRKWVKTYGVSLSPREARKIIESHGLKVIKHHVEENGRNMWLWFQK